MQTYEEFLERLKEHAQQNRRQQRSEHLKKPAGKPKNIFESLKKCNEHEPAFEPEKPADRNCPNLPGSKERIAEYCRRLEEGQEMWNSGDYVG